MKYHSYMHERSTYVGPKVWEECCIRYYLGFLLDCKYKDMKLQETKEIKRI